MPIKQNKDFIYGYNSITEMTGKYSDMLMDFGILKMDNNQTYSKNSKLESAYLLLFGKIKIEWDNNSKIIDRDNCFDANPSCLHVPPNTNVTITCLNINTEIAVIKTSNNKTFKSVMYTPENIRSEMRGKGTMKETSTRNVRTIFDKKNAPNSNLVLGEVIGYPGKWSSYPPHHHPQPEIYFYKFNPSNGYGFSELGNDVIKLEENITVKVTPGKTHPQVCAPGYAMYYLWAIRHLEGNPYIEPIFVEEHTWVTKKDAIIWPDKK